MAEPVAAPRPGAAGPAWPGLRVDPVLLMAGAAFSLALFFNFGYKAGGSFALVALGVLGLLLGTLLRHWAPDLGGGALAGAFVAWLAFAVALAVSDEAWSYFVMRPAREVLPVTTRCLFLLGLALVVLGATEARWDRRARWGRRLSILRVVVFALAFVLGAHWTIGQSPDPAIDVYHMHTDAVDRLLHLKNPYSPNLPFAGRVIEFYGYPPVTLLAQVPFHVLLDDVRYASVAGILVAGWAARGLARRARLPSFAADAAGALLVVQGRPFYMVEQGWTEPVVAGLAGIAALAWARRSRATAVLAALAMASKQFLWPFVLLLLRVPGLGRRRLVVATAVLAALFLPFFLWGPERFWYGVVETHVTGEAVSLAYPDVQPGDPWPFTSTLAIHLQEYGIEWPVLAGPLLWLAVAASFAMARDRDLGTLFVSAACAVAVVGFFGTAIHPNYMWLLPTLAVLGVLADRARAASAEAPRPAARSTGTSRPAAAPTRDPAGGRENA